MVRVVWLVVFNFLVYILASLLIWLLLHKQSRRKAARLLRKILRPIFPRKHPRLKPLGIDIGGSTAKLVYFKPLKLPRAVPRWCMLDGKVAKPLSCRPEFLPHSDSDAESSTDDDALSINSTNEADRITPLVKNRLPATRRLMEAATASRFGELRFMRIPTAQIPAFMSWVSRHRSSFRYSPEGLPTNINATGGGAWKFAAAAGKIGVKFVKRNELAALVRGMNFLLVHSKDEIFTVELAESSNVGRDENSWVQQVASLAPCRDATRVLAELEDRLGSTVKGPLSRAVMRTLRRPRVRAVWIMAERLGQVLWRVMRPFRLWVTEVRNGGGSGGSGGARGGGLEGQGDKMDKGLKEGVGGSGEGGRGSSGLSSSSSKGRPGEGLGGREGAGSGGSGRRGVRGELSVDELSATVDSASCGVAEGVSGAGSSFSDGADSVKDAARSRGRKRSSSTGSGVQRALLRIVPRQSLRPTFPYLLVNIGSGISIVVVSSPYRHRRVSGTAIGGGTFWGLTQLLTGLRSWSEVAELCDPEGPGNNESVDLTVGDIYGPSGCPELGLPANLVASSFGRAGILLSQQEVARRSRLGSDAQKRGRSATRGGASTGSLGASRVHSESGGRFGVGQGGVSPRAGRFQDLVGSGESDDDKADSASLRSGGGERGRNGRAFTSSASGRRDAGTTGSSAVSGGGLSTPRPSASVGDAHSGTAFPSLRSQDVQDSVPCPVFHEPSYVRDRASSAPASRGARTSSRTAREAMRLGTGRKAVGSVDPSGARSPATGRSTPISPLTPNSVNGGPMDLSSDAFDSLKPSVKVSSSGAASRSGTPTHPKARAGRTAGARPQPSGRNKSEPPEAMHRAPSGTIRTSATPFHPADIVRSLLFMLCNNTAQLAYLCAKLYDCRRIFFTGGFVMDNPLAWERLAYSALFMRHDGYLGAFGCLLDDWDE